MSGSRLAGHLRPYHLLPVAGGLILLAGCTSAASTLEPRGPRAADIAGLWWLMFWLALAVYLVVVVILALALLRPRRARAGQDPTQPVATGPRSTGRIGLTYLIGAGVLMPAIIVLVVMIATVQTMSATAAPTTPARVTVDVVGFQFW